jgi:hypothetical protein
MHFGEENPCFDKLRRIHVKLRDRHSASTYFYLLLTHHLANNLRIPLTRLVSCFSLLTRFILFFCIPRRLSCHPWPAGYFASPAWAMTRRRETTCTAASEEQSRSAWRYKPCVRVRHSSCRHFLNSPSSTRKTTQSSLGYLCPAGRRFSALPCPVRCHVPLLKV